MTTVWMVTGVFWFLVSAFLYLLLRVVVRRLEKTEQERRDTALALDRWKRAAADNLRLAKFWLGVARSRGRQEDPLHQARPATLADLLGDVVVEEDDGPDGFCA